VDVSDVCTKLKENADNEVEHGRYVDRVFWLKRRKSHIIRERCVCALKEQQDKHLFCSLLSHPGAHAAA
jgi:hypothetical protein